MPLPSQSSRSIDGLDEDSLKKTLLVFGRQLPIVEQIGDGAKSTVYLCRNTEGHRPATVAVKRMYFDAADVEHAHKEMNVLAELRHPCVVEYFDAEIARTEGRMCVSLVMEYCPNSLTRILVASQKRGGRLPEKSIVGYVDNIVSALSFLHSRSPPIAHRDVKAENILIGADGNCKLCDFGSATTVAYHCQTRQEVQLATSDIERHTTLAYRAPEMVDPWQRQRIDEAVDVWSLGVLIYYLMTFSFPFPGETSLAILNGSLSFPGWMPATYSKDLMELVRRCLTKDPAQRPNIHAVGEYLHAVFGVTTEFTQKPDDWEPQLVQESHRATEHVFDEQGKNSVAETNLRGKPNLFSMLNWQSGGNQQSGSSPAAATIVQPLPSVPVSAATAKELDDLFQWDNSKDMKNSSVPQAQQQRTVPPPPTSAGTSAAAFDALFADAPVPSKPKPAHDLFAELF